MSEKGLHEAPIKIYPKKARLGYGLGLSRTDVKTYSDMTMETIVTTFPEHQLKTEKGVENFKWQKHSNIKVKKVFS